MKQVTKEQFWNEIDSKKLDLCISCVGNYPYTSEFKYRNGQLWGKITQRYKEGTQYPEIKEYFINI